MIDTPFGKQSLFDAHVHFLSHVFMAKLGTLAGISDAPASKVCEKLDWELPPEDPLELGRKWVAELDAHGVDRSVLLHTLPGDAASIAAAVRAFPDRLIGYVMINPTEPSAIETLTKAVDDWGFRGVTLFPAMHRFELASDHVRKVFELAHDRRLAIFVHCGVLKVAFLNALGIPCDFDATNANPLALQRLAAEFTNIRFIIPHLGSGLLRELLMLADTCPNVYTDTSSVDGWARYLPGRMTAEDCLKQVLEVIGPQRVLFGSDSSFFPRGWRKDVYTRQMDVFQRVGLTSDETRMILGGNLTMILDEAAGN